jgi:AraC-like DNA-binding protein
MAAERPRPSHDNIVTDLRIARVLRAVRAEPARHWRVTDLAKLAGASRAAFARLFRAATGTSPKRWLTARRLEQVASLLASSGATLGEIANHVGYTSEFALSRAFKRQYGLAPASYRKMSSPIRCAA